MRLPSLRSLLDELEEEVDEVAEELELDEEQTCNLGRLAEIWLELASLEATLTSANLNCAESVGSLTPKMASGSWNIWLAST